MKYSYETLNNLLSTAENFAGLQNEKYRDYNITTSYDYENLKSEFVWELHCFQLAVQQFEKNLIFIKKILKLTLKDIKKGLQIKKINFYMMKC